MTAVGLIRGPYRLTAKAFAVAISLMAVGPPVVANAVIVSPLTPFLLKSGEAGGFEPGKTRTFRTVAAVRKDSGERLAKPEISRYETEGFAEAATARLGDRAEPAAGGISSVFEFETPTGAKAEMNAELKEELSPEALRTGAGKYFIVRHFKVPEVPKAVAYEVVSDKAAAEIGIESGLAKALFVEGNCLLAVGILRPTSIDVIEPVVRGVQAIYGRTDGTCP